MAFDKFRDRQSELQLQLQTLNGQLLSLSSITNEDAKAFATKLDDRSDEFKANDEELIKLVAACKVFKMMRVSLFLEDIQFTFSHALIDNCISFYFRVFFHAEMKNSLFSEMMYC